MDNNSLARPSGRIYPALQALAALLLVLLIPSTAAADPPATSFAALAESEALSRGNKVRLALTPIGDVGFVEMKFKFLALTDTSIIVEAPVDYSWERTGLRSVWNEEFGTDVIAIPEERVYRVVREPSKAGLSALIGAGAGFGVVGVPILASCTDEECLAIAGVAGGLFAGIGALAGWGIYSLATSPDEVFMQPSMTRPRPVEFTVAPLVSKERKGLVFVIRW